MSCPRNPPAECLPDCPSQRQPVQEPPPGGLLTDSLARPVGHLPESPREAAVEYTGGIWNVGSVHHSTLSSAQHTSAPSSHTLPTPSLPAGILPASSRAPDALPVDVLVHIFQSLPAPRDRRAFCAVCRPWRTAVLRRLACLTLPWARGPLPTLPPPSLAPLGPGPEDPLPAVTLPAGEASLPVGILPAGASSALWQISLFHDLSSLEATLDLNACNLTAPTAPPRGRALVHTPLASNAPTGTAATPSARGQDPVLLHATSHLLPAADVPHSNTGGTGCCYLESSTDSSTSSRSMLGEVLAAVQQHTNLRRLVLKCLGGQGCAPGKGGCCCLAGPVPSLAQPPVQAPSPLYLVLLSCTSLIDLCLDLDLCPPVCQHRCVPHPPCGNPAACHCVPGPSCGLLPACRASVLQCLPHLQTLCISRPIFSYHSLCQLAGMTLLTTLEYPVHPGSSLWPALATLQGLRSLRLFSDGSGHSPGCHLSSPAGASLVAPWPLSLPAVTTPAPAWHLSTTPAPACDLGSPSAHAPAICQLGTIGKPGVRPPSSFAAHGSSRRGQGSSLPFPVHLRSLHLGPLEPDAAGGDGLKNPSVVHDPNFRGPEGSGSRGSESVVQGRVGGGRGRPGGGTTGVCHAGAQGHQGLDWAREGKLGLGGSVRFLLEACLGAHSGLTALTLSGVPSVHALPPALCRAPALASLSLCSLPELGSLPEGLGELQCLSALCLSNLPLLPGLPPSLVLLPALTTLSISECPALGALPGGLGRLRALRALALEALPALTALPPSLLCLTGLASLSISACALRQLPQGMAALEGLTHLRLGLREHQRVPENLGQMPGLKSLSLKTSGGWTSIPESTFAGYAQGTLRELRLLACNSCNYLPSTFTGLSALTRLDVTVANYLYTFAQALGALPALRALRLRVQSFNIFPVHVRALLGPLWRLEELHIEDGRGASDAVPAKLVLSLPPLPSLRTLTCRCFWITFQKPPPASDSPASPSSYTSSTSFLPSLTSLHLTLLSLPKQGLRSTEGSIATGGTACSEARSEAHGAGCSAEKRAPQFGEGGAVFDEQLRNLTAHRTLTHLTLLNVPLSAAPQDVPSHIQHLHIQPPCST